jgi:hypothetical protein
LSRRQLLRGALTLVVLAAVGYFFARSLADNWAAVRATPVTVDWSSVLAVVLFAGAVPVSGLLWGRMLAGLGGVPVSRSDAIRVQCASWLLKYVPGQVGSVANKVLWAGGRGISRTLVVITFVYENVFLLLGSIVPTIVILAFSNAFVDAPDDLVGSLLPVAIAMVPLLLVTDRRLFRWAVNLIARRTLHRDVPPEYFLSSRDGLRYQLAFLVPRIVNGVGFVLVTTSFLDVDPAAFVPLAAVYVLAGAVGILAVFVPSGIGVRESVIVLLASRYLPIEQAIIASLLARLYSTLGDAVVALLYGALRLRESKRGRSS